MISHTQYRPEATRLAAAILHQLAQRHGVQCEPTGATRRLTHRGLTICVVPLDGRRLEECRGRADFRELYEDLTTFGWETRP